MKKKRSIQKLSFHKERISTLNAVTGGADVTTTIVNGATKAASIVAGGCVDTCDCPNVTYNWMICVALRTEDC
ncbi:class I lanthipeptide [uncultured Kordia sp.]|uniref:class I lanthipeptide n=1 Tax=uncultured Kordia sp. TaxID=507699 RepID=UPI00262772E9|nr:class I lanthipeptide [uncultured Kordia sp.]